MRAVWATYLRELRAYFVSPLAYVVMFFFLLVNGFVFAFLVNALSNPAAPAGPPMTFFFGGITLLLLLILGVVLTMRLVSEELRSGSIEVLMTAPVTEGQVIGGKYLAVFSFFLFLWLPTLIYAAIVERHSEVDWGPVAAGYFAVLLIGAFFLAIGIFASAMTSSQLASAMVTAVLLLLLLLLPLLGEVFTGEGLRQVLSYVDLNEHLQELSRGIVDTRRLVFYVSATLFFLFLASRALEDKKWR
ncbi:MAG TPA: ABC transporter permease subunit [Thermoanaerobaculia bacterium]|nr:ABC transporter permease subunit [Thermoanaerobaculia bacterium]